MKTLLKYKKKTKAFFATQNRCVTKEDYEARVLNMTSKYGAIAKVYVTRSEESATEDEYDSQIDAIRSLTDSVLTYQLLLEGMLDSPDDLGTLESLKQTIGSTQSSGFIPDLSNAVNDLPANLIINNNNFATIDIYVLGYNNQKQLVGNPHTVLL